MEFLKPLTAEMLDLCLTLDPGFADLENLSFLESSGEFVYLLGVCFCSNDLKGIRAFSSSRLWFTYRKNFPAIGGTGPTSDRGWGCMLRCGQMLLAQALSIVHLGRNWQWQLKSQDPNYRRLLAMFQDKRTSLFSIHQIAQMGVSEGKPLGQWLGPNTIAQVLKKLVVYDDWSQLAVHVAMDNILISDDVRIMAAQDDLNFASMKSSNGSETDESQMQIQRRDWKRPLLVIVPLRLGLTAINKCYLPAIKEFFKLPQCAGILGGRPNHAVYFYGCAGDKLIYLDPHTCQEVVELRNTSSKYPEPFSATSPTSDPEQMEFVSHVEKPVDFEKIEQARSQEKSSSNTGFSVPPGTPNISCSTTTDNMSAEEAEMNSSNAGVLLSFSNSSSMHTSNRNSPNSFAISEAASMNDECTMDSLDTICPMTASTTTAMNEDDRWQKEKNGLSEIREEKDDTDMENLEGPQKEEQTAGETQQAFHPLSEAQENQNELCSHQGSLDQTQSPCTSFVACGSTDVERSKQEGPQSENARPDTACSSTDQPSTEDLFDDSTYHCPYLLNMAFTSLDPSLALAFVCVCEEDYSDLVERLKTSVLNASSPPLFEILDKRPKGWPKFVPYAGHDDSFKINEYDDFGDPQFDSDDNFEILE
ncbi:peptidase family c54 domain-containing protein [Ditylenchus destructor]|uniref:Cysteine protease n=1 Tax=Ditylenchus destructor TaxID=166010 RepID=A0AAD4MSY2_9BILA|nr:peptidase family c54 domain-containing protein [Ditylenchus destructor]